MNVTKVTIGRTFNIGNYQSLRVELEADITGTGISVAGAALSLDQKLNTMKKLLGSDYAKSCAIVSQPEKYSKSEIKTAQDYIDQISNEID